MKINMKIYIALVGSAFALSACGLANDTMDRAFSRLDVAAGHRIDEGGFGNPSLNNQLAQTAYADQDGLLWTCPRSLKMTSRR